MIFKKIKKSVTLIPINDAYEAIKPFTLCRPSKLLSLRSLSEHINTNGIAGDFVECGTYKGGAAAMIASELGNDRKIWLYDSFEGMPNVTAKDGNEAAKWVGECIASVEDVKQIMQTMRIPSQNITIRKGWFSDTFKEPTSEKIAFLHIDADWYESVRIALDTFYEKVVEGVVIVLDDFGHWEGCREAFYDFCAEKKIRPLLERFENDQAFWFKGRSNNRDGWVHQPNR